MSKVIHWIMWFVIIGNLALLSLVAFWLLYPYQLPYIQQPINIENKNKEIAIGETIVMTLHVSKPQEIVSTSRPNITCEDGNLVTLSNSNKTIPKGEYTITSNTYVLPPKVSRGAICQFNFVNTYQLNPLRSETKTWSSEQFKVI